MKLPMQFIMDIYWYLVGEVAANLDSISARPVLSLEQQMVSITMLIAFSF